MSTIEIDPVFSVALRAALVEHVVQAAVRERRHRVRVGVGAFLGLGLAAGGVAVAGNLLPLPGADVASELAAPLTVTRTGPATIELGAAPKGATHIALDLTCLTAGSFTFDDGARVNCSGSDAGERVSSYTLPLAPGQHTTSIRAGEGAEWKLTATYMHLQSTAWAVNAKGDTYGVVNGDGTPDLVAVEATNGRTGYAYARDLAGAEGPRFTSPADALAWQAAHQGTSVSIPVYEADGETVVGEFVIGDGAAASPSARS